MRHGFGEGSIIAMSADENLSHQFQQLQMFYPARELISPLKNKPVGHFLPGDKQEGEDNLGAWTRTVKTARNSEMHPSILEKGVQTPVNLYGGPDDGTYKPGTILNGHHRIASSWSVGEDTEVPVNWLSKPLAGPAGELADIVHNPSHYDRSRGLPTHHFPNENRADSLRPGYMGWDEDERGRGGFVPRSERRGAFNANWNSSDYRDWHEYSASKEVDD